MQVARRICVYGTRRGRSSHVYRRMISASVAQAIRPSSYSTLLLYAGELGKAALPGPLDVHSASSYQCVARKASATFGSVCFA